MSAGVFKGQSILATAASTARWVAVQETRDGRVQLIIGGSEAFLTPDEADALAEALNDTAAEVTTKKGI